MKLPVETLRELIRKLRAICAGLPDKRTGKNVRYTMVDVGMAAFSVFFMQSPSFLAHQLRLQQGSGHGRSNCGTLFEMTAIPCDHHIRALLDPVDPKQFSPVFDAALDAMEQPGELAAFRRLNGAC